ncbi:MAG TPA: hypothetical protein PK002_10685, partial [Cellvibrio sp.]|nr:hypothetical protein [Cellvibrio sp.]
MKTQALIKTLVVLEKDTTPALRGNTEKAAALHKNAAAFLQHYQMTNRYRARLWRRASEPLE